MRAGVSRDSIYFRGGFSKVLGDSSGQKGFGFGVRRIKSPARAGPD